jgi:3-isopropylmalate dehydrogenase
MPWDKSKIETGFLGLVTGNAHTAEPKPPVKVMGLLTGEGIGPEVIQAALKVLDALETTSPLKIQRRFGETIGLAACRNGQDNEGQITQNVASFCAEIFAQGGAIMCGPGGGRFVYDLRRRFDLFCKIVPIKPSIHLRSVNRLKSDALEKVDILVVRDNAGGVYQGCWSDRNEDDDGRIVEHRFSYSETQVARIIGAAARLSQVRKKKLHVIIKDGGVPSISKLWRQVAQRICAQTDIECICLNADNAAYRLIQHPDEFDVMVTPNMVGDILADLGAVLLGSRGLSYSANFSGQGEAVYQTGHGAAFDLTGTNRANPVAQILTMAMMLRESYGCHAEASLIERAIDDVWRAGWRTEDLVPSGNRVVGTQRMGELIAEAVLIQAENRVCR